VKEVLYYDGRGGAFCLLLDEAQKKVVARGVSVCSKHDQFVKKVGRAKAKGRAYQALARGYSLNAIQGKMKEEYELPCDYFACYQPELTDYEKELVEKF
jgi:hypothetical protein